MIHIERSFDYGLIKAIMTHPAVYRHLTDDTAPPAAEFRPIVSDLIWYLLAWDGDECSDFGCSTRTPPSAGRSTLLSCRMRGATGRGGRRK
jgi:hypothetical protein